MTEPYVMNFKVRWSDLDANGHMRNTAYMDLAMQTRIAYMASQGATPAKFREWKMGPIVFKDETRYVREVNLLDEIAVSLYVGGLSVDGSKFTLVNRLHRDEVLVADIISWGAWFHLEQRKVVAPPPKLREVWEACTTINLETLG